MGEREKIEFIVYHEDTKDTEIKSDLHENKSLNAESQRRKRSQRKPLEQRKSLKGPSLRPCLSASLR
jgi:hypothetical protein